VKQNKYTKVNFIKPQNEKYKKVLNLVGFWPPHPGEMTKP
jgi:hypothetical protein